MNKNRLGFLLAAFAAFALTQGAVAAAKPAAAPAAAASGDVKEFGDWTVRCGSKPSPAPCEMLELRVAKKTGQRVLGVLLVYVPARNASVMQVAVPLGVALQNGLVLASDTYTSPVLHFSRCDMQGCYVQTALDPDSMNALSRATKVQMQVVLVDGKRLDLPLSMDGFGAAHSALVDQAKAKAVNPPPDASAAGQPAQ